MRGVQAEGTILREGERHLIHVLNPSAIRVEIFPQSRSKGRQHLFLPLHRICTHRVPQEIVKVVSRQMVFRNSVHI